MFGRRPGSRRSLRRCVLSQNSHCWNDRKEKTGCLPLAALSLRQGCSSFAVSVVLVVPLRQPVVPAVAPAAHAPAGHGWWRLEELAFAAPVSHTGGIANEGMRCVDAGAGGSFSALTRRLLVTPTFFWTWSEMSIGW